MHGSLEIGEREFEREENARRQVRAKLLLKEGSPPNCGAQGEEATLHPTILDHEGSGDGATTSSAVSSRQIPFATVTDQTCWELIRQAEMDDRAERVRQAGKPGLSRALTEAALLNARRVLPYRKILEPKPLVSPPLKWKVQPFEPPMAWVAACRTGEFHQK
ncbi:unnamed protein product [Symbiodinium sp. CCMP2592]|nr:unnamed protein product [Symbiodinium sp. CCMP2592]